VGTGGTRRLRSDKCSLAPRRIFVRPSGVIGDSGKSALFLPGKYELIHTKIRWRLFNRAGLIQDPAGNLYGTTGGGSIFSYSCDQARNFCFGVVFRVDTTGTETALYSFTGGSDGPSPGAGVIRDSVGNFYGTTTEGGILTPRRLSGDPL
jgi:hypothetical protein